jgi:transcriptional regulator with XRE-family HTH domain
MDPQIPQAKIIGDAIMEARLANGYRSRASLVDTKKLKSKITQEGLRKIEHGQRVPKLENLRLLAETLGISQRKIRELEKLALEANIQRATRRAGNATVSFEIEGKPIKLFALPPKRKTEAFVRRTVDELVRVVNRYGVLPKDTEHFRRHARSILLRRLSS